jgi:protein required for attachment to host cells
VSINKSGCLIFKYSLVWDMNKYLVAVIDGGRARFFTLAPVQFPEHESGPDLVEQESLTNATGGMADQELWANVKTGRNRGSGGKAHSYDDHRQRHRVEFEKRFAQAIAAKLTQLIQTHEPQELLLVAEPQILGLMRDTLTPNMLQGVPCNELARDLCHLKAGALHEHLARKGLLPPHRYVSRLA